MPKRFSADSVLCNQSYDVRNGIYEIPDFQKPYSWEESEIEQLFQDIYHAQMNKKASYYLGPVILVQEGNEKNKRLKVIDGQQRLTTLTIFFTQYASIFNHKNWVILSTQGLLPSLWREA
jgi:uncharacterized protein with ParB-like and HNH nuclease domain